MKLIIVESPTKAKTISKFLSDQYQVESSYGHVRDLPKSRLGVDIENNFTPRYIIPQKAKPRVAALKKAVSQADSLILATDEDREGEAIAWHLTQVLNLSSDIPSLPVWRIVFHEITKSAIKKALENPRSIDMNLVNAQQARRILDRLVGYKLSPFLWKKVRYGLSAGRVQSVAVRLIVEREEEIKKFVREEYWSIEAQFEKEDKIFKAKLIKLDDKQLEKLDIKEESVAQKIKNRLANDFYVVDEILKKEIVKSPPPPFTTATLQQEAARKLGFSAKQTMLLAQQLYEEGFITYMRTDSVNLAESALIQAKEIITNQFGANYALSEPRRYLNKNKNVQEAHEAIRPTDFSNFPQKNLFENDRNKKKLYELIWKRSIASQMQTAKLEQTIINIIGKKEKAIFRASGQVIKFDGFIKIYSESQDNSTEEEDKEILPILQKGEILNLLEIIPRQHFTEPPPRYTDATLIKTLESEGIGRPSTYAPILSTIQERGYVKKMKKFYQPTEIGIIVNNLLVKHFPEIVDLKFTSHIEEQLDKIAEGKINWVDVCREFYFPFEKQLKEKEKTVLKQEEISNVPCPHCKKMMIIKFGRFGKFLSCPNPESKVTLPLPEEAEKIKNLSEQNKNEKCPLCGGPMEVKRGRFGFFLGCLNYPQCQGIKKIENKTGIKCPQCGNGELVERKVSKSKGKGRIFWGCSLYPNCNYATWEEPRRTENKKEITSENF